MRIGCLADLHGYLPDLRINIDLLIIAGDICPDGKAMDQAVWLDKDFRDWLDSYKFKVFATWGNHDFVGETKAVPEGLRWEVLVNRVQEWEGLRIAGFPWTTVRTGWAFHKPRAVCEAFAQNFYHDLDCDIIISHTPPHAIGDLAPDGERVGSYELARFMARGNAKTCVTGHIHEGRGIYHLPDGGLVVNAAYLDGAYNPYKLDIPVIEVL